MGADIYTVNLQRNFAITYYLAWDVSTENIEQRYIVAFRVLQGTPVMSENISHLNFPFPCRGYYPLALRGPRLLPHNL